MKPILQFSLTFLLILVNSLAIAQNKNVTGTKENHAPEFVKEMPDTFFLTGKTLSFRYEAIDPDGDLVKYSTESLMPINATLDSLTGFFVWRPANNQRGKYELVVKASDGKLVTSSRKAIITIEFLWDDFGSVNYSCNPTEGGTIVKSMSNDTITAVAKANKGFVFKNWTVNGNFVSTDSIFTFKFPNITWNVEAIFRVNHAPVFVKEMPDTRIEAAKVVAFTYQAIDPDGDSVKYYLFSKSELLMKIDSTTGFFVCRGQHTQIGNNYDLIIAASDGNLTTLSKKAVISVYIIPSVESEILPTEFKLSQNYPNPFNPETTIEYSIPVETRHASSLQHVTLKVYDVLGREVVTLVEEYKQPGNYKVIFNVKTSHATSLPSGVYFYQLRAGSYFETKKLVLLK